MSARVVSPLAFSFIVASLFSCQSETKHQVTNTMLNLKRGEIISCGPADGEIFGTISFTASVPEDAKTDFNMAIALLHSFEYDEAEKMFAKVIDKHPGCAMAYWGVAMSNFHPLWAPPGKDELEKGLQAVNIARSIKDKTEREADYIEAIGRFFENAESNSHRERVLLFEKEMEKIYQKYKGDTESAVFYALSLNAAAEPTDKTYSRQKKAIGILNALFELNPMHPGLAHYIIHNSDYPALAEMALPAARKYAAIAPASAHAQHMPSHIFTRLGLWKECIESNLVATSAAKCYAQQAKLKGHWDEELHGMDYLMYAYLQRGDDKHAKQQLDYLYTIKEVEPLNFKVAYAFAAMPARYFLEKRMWKEAATLEGHVAGFPWQKFPWQRSIIHFTRVLGLVNLGDIQQAKKEVDSMRILHSVLNKTGGKTMEASQVEVQIMTSEAWIAFKEGDHSKALRQMASAAVMEDATEKHPVTPGEVIPARELLGEMLLQMNEPALALKAFRLCLQTHANRFHSLYGAATAADKTGDKITAREYFKKLMEIADIEGLKRTGIKVKDHDDL